MSHYFYSVADDKYTKSGRVKKYSPHLEILANFTNTLFNNCFAYGSIHSLLEKKNQYSCENRTVVLAGKSSRA